jgi:hypothetical protein
MQTDYSYAGMVRPNVSKTVAKGDLYVERVVLDGPVLEFFVYNDDKLVGKGDSDDVLFQEPLEIHGTLRLVVQGPETVKYLIFYSPAKLP